MTIELAIAISGLVGLYIGLAIGKNGRKERDERITELEKELTTIRNVAESQNDTINRMRKKIERKKGGKANDDL